MAAKKASDFGGPAPLPGKKRRRPVPGEDLPAMKNVMKEIQNQAISLEDFLILISPHTGDKGILEIFIALGCTVNFIYE